MYRNWPYICIMILSCLCGYLMYQQTQRKEVPHPVVQLAKPEPRVAILTAKQDLHAGEVLSAEEMGETSVPKAFMSPGAMPASAAVRQRMVGALLRVSVPKGGPIRTDDVVHSGDGSFLAALLMPGQRGIAISIDPGNAVGGLIWPGDHVDVLLVPTINTANSTSGDHSQAAETILRNVRVVAIDQRLIRGVSPNPANQSNARTAVLELSPADAQKLALAQKMGRIILTLRSLMRLPSDPDAAGTVWNEDVFQPEFREKKEVEPTVPMTSTSLRVFNGLAEVSSNAH
ncbi:Flp pilus assembly protein CpaB [Acetobacter estunensis]|uniref:Flp pilus assembly protein CpaB n=1 Tax=Acetobacter estunensis TaxID=104097 RepID=UPI001C2D478D|nr:Flp pilus assembly protein CpaB [Acetobacter estunensis]